MSLTEYRRKRQFDRTAEPAGKGRTSTKRAGRQFVVQKHDATRLHYDFRLELDGVLKSWAVPQGPSLDPSEKRLAVEVEDHPLEYGGFEGIIPAGEYGGGTVLLWDRGTWSAVGNPADGFRQGKLKFHLEGGKLRGGWMLVRMRRRSGEKANNWLLIKERDDEARSRRDYDVLVERPESVASGRTTGEIAANPKRNWTSKRTSRRKASVRGQGTRRARTPSRNGAAARLHGARKAPFPRAVEPQLARLVDRPPEGEAWVHEIKFDGYRLLSFIDQGDAVLKTRNHLDWTSRFPELAEDLSLFPARQAVLDGEVVAQLPNGTSSFQELQEALSARKTGRLVYYVFDLLYCDGYDLRGMPLEDRKRKLIELIPSDARGRIRFPEHMEGSGAEIFRKCSEMGLEGIVSKRRDQPYVSGRNDDWLKAKAVQREEFVIGGYTDSTSSRRTVAAILVGYFEAGRGLVYAGKVGTGFSEKTERDVHERLKAREISKSPFAGPTERAVRPHWVKPELVAQIEYTNRTRDGCLRHPVFLGLREDKPASAVRDAPANGRTRSGTKKRPSHSNVKAAPQAKKSSSGRLSRARQKKKLTPDEEAALAKVALTHPDRVFYPAEGITKLDLIHYYAHVAEWMLPHIVNRPLSLVRCPEGVGGLRFFQKHAAAGTPDTIKRVQIKEKETTEPYLYIDGLAGLLSVVQMGVLGIHLWGSTIDDLEHPDRMIFDLDPDPSVRWRRVIEAALEVKDRLARQRLASFVKTTGGKGLHIVVPLQPQHGWDEVKQFSKAIADQMASDSPQDYTSNMSKAARKGRIYIDYVRNSRGATAVAPWSTRAHERATVSMPLSWDELAGVRGADQFRVEGIDERMNDLRHDPWKKLFSVRQSLARLPRK